MQQERSFLRRVCVLKPFIYENCPSSRRAYFSIRLAVKTSRPHCFIYQIPNLEDNSIMQRYINLVQFPMFTTDTNYSSATLKGYSPNKEDNFRTA